MSYIFRFRPPKRFVILTHARSGSTLLAGIFNAHPEVHCLGEILNPAFEYYGDVSSKTLWRRRLHLAGILDFCGPIMPSAVRCVGFKMFQEHLAPGEDLGDLIRPYTYSLLSATMDKANIVVLFRSSLVETFVSLELAFQTAVWCSPANSNQIQRPKSRIHLDWGHFLGYVVQTKQTWKKIMQQLAKSKLPFLLIEYEELREPSRRAETMSRVCAFIGASSTEPCLFAACDDPPLAKQSSQLSDQVSNFYELELERRMTDDQYTIGLAELKAYFHSESTF